MLACARLGAAHSVVFGGSRPDALRDRINDAEAKVLITQDEGWRAGKVVPLKQNADDAVAGHPSIEKVVVLRRTGNDVPWDGERDVWWHDLVEGQSADCPPEAMDAEDLLYLLYTRGPRPSPRGSCIPPAGT
jgi:acetyl-CoA synthetase